MKTSIRCCRWSTLFAQLCDGFNCEANGSNRYKTITVETWIKRVPQEMMLSKTQKKNKTLLIILFKRLSEKLLLNQKLPKSTIEELFQNKRR